MKVLCVIDMQNDFIDGVLGTPEAKAIVPKVVYKIKENDLVIFTQYGHCYFNVRTIESKLLPEHCIMYTNGWALHPDIEPLAQENVFQKNSFMCLVLKDIIKSIIEYDDSLRL